MKIYSAHGINDFIVCLGYKGYVIKEYFANYFLHMSDVTFDMRDNSMKVHQRQCRAMARHAWSIPARRRRSAAASSASCPTSSDDEAFCLTYGDGVGDVDIARRDRSASQARRRLATVTAMQPPGRFGALGTEGNRVIGFQEKPHGDGGWINGGFFVLSPEGRRLHRGRRDGVGARAAWSGSRTRANSPVYFHHGFWQPMDTLARQAASRRALGGRQGAVENLVRETFDARSDHRQHGLCRPDAGAPFAAGVSGCELIGSTAAFSPIA